LTGQWAARVRHLLLFVATARMLFQLTPRFTRSSLNVDRQVFVGRPRHLPLPRWVHDMVWLAGRPADPDDMACYLKLAKRCKIGPSLLLITNRKSNTGFQMTFKSLTLDDLECTIVCQLCSIVATR